MGGRTRNRQPIESRKVNPVLYAEAFAQSVGMEKAFSIASGNVKTCTDATTSGSAVFTSREIAKTLGHWRTVAGYLKNKLERKNAAKR